MAAVDLCTLFLGPAFLVAFPLFLEVRERIRPGSTLRSRGAGAGWLAYAGFTVVGVVVESLIVVSAGLGDLISDSILTGWLPPVCAGGFRVDGR